MEHGASSNGEKVLYRYDVHLAARLLLLPYSGKLARSEWAAVSHPPQKASFVTTIKGGREGDGGDLAQCTPGGCCMGVEKERENVLSCPSPIRLKSI